MAKAVKQWSKKYQMFYFENLENNIFIHHNKTLCMFLFHTCWQGDNKSVEARDTNICAFREEVCFFTDAVGLYTVRLPCSINVNQHGFFWERNTRSGYNRGLWGVSLESIPQDDATGSAGQTLLAVRRDRKKSVFKSFRVDLCCTLPNSF